MKTPNADLIARCVNTLTWCLLILLGIAACAVVAAKCHAGIGYFINRALLSLFLLVPYGHQLYTPLGHGSVSGYIYGPIAALLYLPLYFVPSMNGSIFWGGILSFCATLLPAVWLYARARASAQEKLFMTLLFCFLAFHSASLLHALFCIHADASALCFGALTCLLIGQFPVAQRQTRLLIWAAATSALALWSKQVTLPLAGAIATYLLAMHGRKPAGRYLLFTGAWTLLLTGLFSALFGFGNLLLNMLLIPSRHPWETPRLFWTLHRKEFLIVAACFGWLLLYIRTHPQRLQQGKLRSWFSLGTWTLYWWVSLWMAPVALSSRMKLGGWVNTLSYIFYFFMIAVPLALWEKYLFPLASRRPVRAKATIAASAAVMVVSMLRIVLADLGTMHALLPKVHMETAYRFALRHKGQVYFPNFPYLTLVSERAAYHYSYSVFDRELAGYPIPQRQIRDGIPPDLKYIAVSMFERESYAPGLTGEYMLRFFPEFSRCIRLAELPLWKVYVRKPAPALAQIEQPHE